MDTCVKIQMYQLHYKKVGAFPIIYLSHRLQRCLWSRLCHARKEDLLLLFTLPPPPLLVLPMHTNKTLIKPQDVGVISYLHLDYGLLIT